MSKYVVMRRACCVPTVCDEHVGFCSDSLGDCVAEADRLREAQIGHGYRYWVGEYRGPNIVRVYSSVSEEERTRMANRHYWLNGVYAQHDLKPS